MEFILTDALSTYLELLEPESELLADFHVRIATINSCLQVVGQIAEHVEKWVIEDDRVKDVRRGKMKATEKEIDYRTRDENLIDFDKGDEHLGWGFEDDEPYVNPFTGQWITPITSKSAGPSNYEKTSKNPSDSEQRTLRVLEVIVPHPLVDAEQAIQDKDFSLDPSLGKIHNLIDFDEDDDPPYYETLSPVTAYSLSSNPFSTRPLANSCYSSNTADIHSPGSSLPDSNSELEETVFDYNEGRQMEILQSKWAVDDDIQDMRCSQTANQFHGDLLVAWKMQAQFDEETAQQSNTYQKEAKCAREVEEEEGKKFNVDTVVARRLARDWETQDETHVQNLQKIQAYSAQEDSKYADKSRRDEKERNEAFLRDQAAARAAQDQWEQEQRDIVEDAVKLREQAEREEQEEMERKRVELELAKRLAEELARQEEEELQRVIAELEEAERRERQADCVVCMEPSDKSGMCLLSCDHYYCEDCIVGRVSIHASSRS